jgi:hypothetical protein
MAIVSNGRMALDKGRLKMRIVFMVISFGNIHAKKNEKIAVLSKTGLLPGQRVVPLSKRGISARHSRNTNK